MPHQCTNCGHVFADGSKEMLSGCPDCGGNKFQYHPGEVPSDPTQAQPPERPGEGGVTGTVGKAAAKVRDFVGDDDPTRARTDAPDTPEPAGDDDRRRQPDAPAQAASTDASPAATDTATDSEGGTPPVSNDLEERDSEEVPDREDEDLAQQSARSEMVSADDLPDASERPPAHERGRVVSEPATDERPDMEQLREELNSQFESIRIVSPGTYELNLMELYDREEYIIALQENGRYVIEVPDAWEVQDADEDE